MITIDVEIGGAIIPTMVDTGAQSTIISRDTFHRVIRKMKEDGKPAPTLELPKVRLYGKDGSKGVELPVTAQVTLVFTVNRKSVSVPVLVQPNSEQACLLGMNALPLLGIVLTDDSGQPLSPSPEANVSNTPPSIPANAHSVNTVTVNLVNSVTIPSQKGRVLKAKVTHTASQLNKELVFEPNWEALRHLVCLPWRC